MQREFGTRSFIAELATTLVAARAHRRRPGRRRRRRARRHPATLHALAAGAISLPQLRSIFETLTGLPADAAAALETAALDRAAQQTNAALRRRLRTLRERLHPEPLDTRHRAAALDRRVVLEPAPDGMAWLSLYLHAERAHAITDRLHRLADTDTAHRLPRRRADATSDPSTPDPRTRAQRVLDTATDLLLAGLRTNHDGHPVDGDAQIVARVLVTVPVLTLLGHTDEPAELDGYGPIPADTARHLAAHAPSFHRILTHPETGAYLSYSRTTYRVPADLARYLRTRDGTCRFPGCARRATTCDLDHTTPWTPPRPHQPRQPRPPLPQPPPPQTPHPLAHDPTPQRHHPLDLTHRPTPHHPPRTPLHPTPHSPSSRAESHPIPREHHSSRWPERLTRSSAGAPRGTVAPASTPCCCRVAAVRHAAPAAQPCPALTTPATQPAPALSPRPSRAAPCRARCAGRARCGRTACSRAGPRRAARAGAG